MEYDVAVADSGNIRVIGAPWQRWEPGGGSEVLFRYIDAATVGQYLKGACPLTAGEQQMLLAVHEVGHYADGWVMRPAVAFPLAGAAELVLQSA